MAVDARVRKTKEKLSNALVELLKEYEFDDITPAQICKKAGINRSTFYRNYKNLVDLKMEMEQSILDSVEWHEGAFNPVRSMESIVSQLRFLDEKHELFGALSSYRFGGSIFEKVSLKLIDNALSQYELHKDRISYEEYEMETVFKISAMTGVIFNWYKNGRQQPYEMVAEYLVKRLQVEYNSYGKK